MCLCLSRDKRLEVDFKLLCVKTSSEEASLAQIRVKLYIHFALSLCRIPIEAQEGIAQPGRLLNQLRFGLF